MGNKKSGDTADSNVVEMRAVNARIRSLTPPNWHKPEIEAARTAKLGPVKEGIVEEGFKEVVVSRLGTTRTVDVLLHLDPFAGTFKLSSVISNWSSPVKREDLLAAIETVTGESTWAAVRTEHGQNLRLDRNSLLDAIHRLEASVAKKKKIYAR